MEGEKEVAAQVQPELEGVGATDSLWSEGNLGKLVAQAAVKQPAEEGDGASDDEAEGEEGGEEVVAEEALEDEEEEASEQNEEADADGDEEPSEKAKGGEPAKVYKARLQDGTSLEIPDDAVFKLKENGRYRKVTFKELKNEHAGKTAWDEKLAELNGKNAKVEAQARKHEAELRAVNNFVGQMCEAAKQGDVFSAIGMLGELVGEEPSNFLDAWMGAFDQFYGEYLKRPEVERKEWQLTLKNKALERKIKQKQSRGEKSKEYEATAQKLNEARAQFEIADDELKVAFGSLVEQNKGSSDGIGVEDVVTRVLDMRVLGNVDLVGEEMKAELTEPEKIHVWRLVKASEQGGQPLAIEDYAELIETVVSRRAEVDEESAKRISRKVRKNPGATPKSGKKEEKKAGSVFGKAKSLDELWGQL